MSTPALRRAADGCLALTALAIPLSTTGMQLGVAGLGILVAVAWLRGEHVVRRSPLDGVLALFFAALALSTLVSGRPWEAVAWRKTWVVLGYFGVYWWLRDPAHGTRLLRFLLLAGTVAALYGILQHYTGVDAYRWLLGRSLKVRPRVEGAEGFAVIGFFRNYLTYADVMVFPLAIAVAEAVSGRLVAMAVIPCLVLALAFSTARGAWLAVGAMGVALACLSRRGLAVLVALAVLGGVAWLGSAGLRGQAAPMLTLGGVNAGRVAIYRANLDIVRDHPVFGLGFGRYRAAAVPYYDRHPDADRRSHAHNNFLHIAAEAGLVGLAAFTLLFVTALRFGYEAIGRGADPTVRAAALGAWLALVAFLVGGLTQYTFGDNEVAVAMWTTLAISMRLRDAA